MDGTFRLPYPADISQTPLSLCNSFGGPLFVMKICRDNAYDSAILYYIYSLNLVSRSQTLTSSGRESGTLPICELFWPAPQLGCKISGCMLQCLLHYRAKSVLLPARQYEPVYADGSVM